MTLKVGVVGLGKMGLLHAGIFNSLDSVKVTCIAEKDRTLRNYLQNFIPEINIYEDYQPMLDNEGLDLVCITTPVSSHLSIALSCIKKEVNFFVEKPVTRNFDESKILCDELKNSEVIHSVGYNRRFVDTFSKVKSLLDSDIIGKVIDVKSSMFVSTVFSKSSSWRFKKGESGGGVLLDLGSHLIDLLCWYFGTVDTVQGKLESLYSTEVEDVAEMDIEFKNGIHSSLKTSWSIEGYRLPEINLNIEGDRGTIRATDDLIEIKSDILLPGFNQREIRISKQSLNKGVTIDLGGPEYTREDEHLIQCIKNHTLPLVNAYEAVKTQSVIETMYKAAYKNEVMKVEYIG